MEADYREHGGVWCEGAGRIGKGWSLKEVIIVSVIIFLKVVIFAIWPQVQPLTGPARRAG